MSGFDNKTGWTHFTPTKWRKYYRAIDGEPQIIKDRFIKNSVPFYFDRSGGLHAKCTDGEMWTILSGMESTFSSEMPDQKHLEPEYIVVSDMGVNFDPELSGVKINKILSELGFQVRIDGVWQPTQQGKNLSIQLEGADSRYGNKPYLKWRFEVIDIIKSKIKNT